LLSCIACFANRHSTLVFPMHIETARHNMIEQQIRTWEVLDQNVLNLLQAVRREEFAPSVYRSLAFADLELPLAFPGGPADAHGQTMMPPKLEARIIQTLALQKHESVLEIGTGSGYLTALLAMCAKHVTSIEIFPEFTAAARVSLQRAGIANVALRTGDGARAQPELTGGQRFDAIILGGSTPVLPAAFLDALQPGGRLFAVIGDAPAMVATLVIKPDSGAMQQSRLFETLLEPLLHAEQPIRFVF